MVASRLPSDLQASRVATYGYSFFLLRALSGGAPCGRGTRSLQSWGALRGTHSLWSWKTLSSNAPYGRGRLEVLARRNISVRRKACLEFSTRNQASPPLQLRGKTLRYLPNDTDQFFASFRSDYCFFASCKKSRTLRWFGAN
jgi:hypothetical protein